jgi:predicted Zn-dependent protease
LLRAIAAGVLILSSPALIAPTALHAQALPNLGGSDSAELSPLMERKLGEDVMNSIRRDPDYISDLPTLDYLNQFGGNLLGATPEARGEAGYDFFFFGVRDPSLNAFALPGGFIGVHSGLVLAAQSESELAGVLAHEIGHVSQRHIARMIGNQKQDSLLPIAGMLLGALAMRASPDLGMAAMMGGAGLAAQRQLSFGRDAEREADRVGVNILNGGGFELNGMVSFFGRLQAAGRNRSDNLPSYLMTHPLTTERIADIEGRIRTLPYRQRVDSLDFSFVRARLRVLQDDTPRGWRDTTTIFNEQLKQGSRAQALGARYGLAMIALRQRDASRAQGLLDDIHSEMTRKPAFVTSALLQSMDIESALARGETAQAVVLVQDGRNRFPLSRALAMQNADVLLAAGRKEEAAAFMRDQAQIYRQDPGVQQALARAYAEQGKQALQHMALAEYYALIGALPAALEQLRIARGSSDASFYDQAIIDARERELQSSWRDVMAQRKKK